MPPPDSEIFAPGPGTGTEGPHLLLSLALLLLLCSIAWSQSQEPPTLHLPLTGTIATHFSTTEPGAADDEDLVQRLAAARPSLVWSACLARAAASFAATTAGRRAESLPPDLLEAVLLHVGCPDPYAEVGTVVEKPGSPADAVTLAIELDRAAARAFTHVGLGRAPEPAGRTRWAVVLTRRLAEVQPFPVRLPSGSTAELRVRLAPGLDRPQLAVILPTGRIQRPALRHGAGDFAADIAVGDQPGTLWIQLVARQDDGDLLAAQLRTGIDVDPPSHWEGLPVVEEPPLVTATEGEVQLARLLNAERGRHGLPPLVLDPELAAAARAHSADMRDAGFFAHRSPSCGDLMARLERAGYPVRSARENIARASGAAVAHAALMASPGHRANILWPELTHLGVGAVRATRGDETAPLVITEIFAVHLTWTTAEAVRDQVLAHLAAARERAGKAPLDHDDRLDRWAERTARQTAPRGKLDPEALPALEAELGPPQEGTTRELRAELLCASDSALLQIPETLIQVPDGTVGIGLDVGAAGDRGPAVTVLLVVVETEPIPVTPPAE